MTELGFNASTMSDICNDKRNSLFNLCPHSESPSLPCLFVLRYRACFAFDGEDGELTLHDGDVITLIEYINDKWGCGSLHGRTGLFPLNFVQLVQESSARKSSPELPGM